MFSLLSSIVSAEGMQAATLNKCLLSVFFLLVIAVAHSSQWRLETSWYCKSCCNLAKLIHLNARSKSKAFSIRFFSFFLSSFLATLIEWIRWHQLSPATRRHLVYSCCRYYHLNFYPCPPTATLSAFLTAYEQSVFAQGSNESPKTKNKKKKKKKKRKKSAQEETLNQAWEWESLFSLRPLTLTVTSATYCCLPGSSCFAWLFSLPPTACLLSNRNVLDITEFDRHTLTHRQIHSDTRSRAAARKLMQSLV